MKKEHRSLLIALALGDGYIDKSGGIILYHSESQQQYVEYKHALINQYQSVELKTRTSNNTKQYGFRIPATKYSKLLRRILYPDGVKVISTRILNRLDLVGLGIWWMDDGSCSTKRNKNTGNIKATVSTLSTQLRIVDNQIIIDWFMTKYGIRFGQRKMKNQHALICGTQEGRKLAALLSPVIIPSMLYKISK